MSTNLPAVLDAALQHLAAAPGKRLRPRLLIAAARATGGDSAAERASSAAEAVEMIHTYSLVHDDLPAMDDDSLRRGQPTLHVAFDEATAILVGDGLQALAFETIATDAGLSPEQRVRLVTCLSVAAGFRGMVGGQSLDIAATGKSLTLDQLKELHRQKTGALIRACLEMGGIVADASEGDIEALRDVGEQIGLAFQIVDDVLDVRADSQTLGKTSGKDEAANKSTYVSLLGIEAAEREAMALYENALRRTHNWGDNAAELRELLGKLVKREH